MRRVLVAVVLALASLSSPMPTGSGIAWGLGGCGGAQKHPEWDVLRPPDERTATTWIAKAFTRKGFEVETGRKIKVGNTTVIADVSAVDKPWSVLWLRADEQQELKGKIPAPPPGVAKGDLWVLDGTDDDADERMLVLFEQNFSYDPDPRGEGGVVRSIQEVEARAVREVKDFLERVGEKK